MDGSRRKPTLPESPTRLWINVPALALTVVVFWWLRGNPDLSILQITVFSILTLAACVAIGEMCILRSFRRASTGLDFNQTRKRSWGDIGTRLLGFFGVVLLIGVGYWTLQEYRAPQFLFYFKFLGCAAPLLFILVPPYFIWLDRYLVDPHDSYWHMGTLLLGRIGNVDRSQIKQFLLAWLIKAFFLPLMFIGLAREMKFFLEADLASVRPQDFYLLGHHLIFGVDLLFSATGYIFTVRLFDSHVRSSEPTLLGWAVALFCYEPFYKFFEGRYIPYDNDFVWSIWLQAHPVWYVGWGSAILFFYGIYVLATLCFGVRFSNLTHRGILTNGPYRICKHPAYISKNLAWWMAAIPFLSGDTLAQSLRYCLLLLCLNAVYFMRARTEERHLSRDPVYVQYALAMNQRSLFAWLGKWIPALRYKAPPRIDA